MALSDTDRALLRRACELAFSSPAAEGAYAVGAIVARASGEVLAEGYSRMDSPRAHAEQSVILRAWAAGYDLSGCVLYCSLQPCYRRLSGERSCQSYIIEAGLSRVIYAVREPEHFLRHAGDDELADSGIEVICADLYVEEVQRANSFAKFD